MDINKENSENIEKLWNKEAYFQLIEDCQEHGGEEAKFLTIKIAEAIKKYNCTSVLDVGCGEGAVLNDLSRETSDQVKYYGVDVAPVGVERAKKRGIKNTEFQVYDGQTIPFPDGTLDFSFSTFVFEHLTKPEEVFSEMFRVTKKDGYIAIACPNYGSPFFRSPCNKDNKIILLLKRLAQSLTPKGFFTFSFHWQKVNPIILPGNQHIMDYDTTVEPNLLFFKKHVEAAGVLSVVEADSFWDKFVYNGNNKYKKKFFEVVSFLGRRKFPYIRYYGPFFFIILQKKV
jgi:SAM-dependent methyltransferase